MFETRPKIVEKMNSEDKDEKSVLKLAVFEVQKHKKQFKQCRNMENSRKKVEPSTVNLPKTWEKNRIALF